MAALSFVLFLVLVLSRNTNTLLIESEAKQLYIPDECQHEGFCAVKPKDYDKLEESFDYALSLFWTGEYGGSKYRIEKKPNKIKPLLQYRWHNCFYVNKTAPVYLYIYGENRTKVDIIVQTKLFKQNVNTVRCVHETWFLKNNMTFNLKSEDEDQRCFTEGSVLSKLGMKSACETIYVNRHLYVYDIEKEHVVLKDFRIPIYCACVFS